MGIRLKDQFIRSSISGEKYATKVEDDFILHIATAHRIPAEWIQRSVNAMNEYKEGCIQDKFYFIRCISRLTESNYHVIQRNNYMWSHVNEFSEAVIFNRKTSIISKMRSEQVLK